MQQSSKRTNSTSAAAERRGKKPFIKEISFLEKAQVELQNMRRYRKDPFKMKKHAFFGTVKEASKGFNMHESKETSSLMANVHVTESSDECNTTRNPSAKAKRSLIGVRKQKNGRYGAVVTDKISHKQVWLGTFDTIEEASHAYLSKKSELEKLSQQGNEEDKPKKNLEQFQQPESPVVASLSVAYDQTLDTASHLSRRKERINSHKTTHIVEVHKNKTSEKEPESSKETSCLMTNVNVTESSDECNTTTSCNPKATRSLLGVRRQKNGRYGAVITDRIRHKQVWLGTFDTIEEASHAYLSKKSEIEKLRQQGNKENKPKNCDQIQQPESPVVASLSVANDQTLDTASHVSKRNERIDSHETTPHFVEVHKNKTSEKEPESSKETSCLMANVSVTESSEECNTTTSCNPKAKRSLLGVRRQKNGKYGAVITDRIRHKQVWLGTFDTIEEASHAYLSKKSEFEQLSQQGNEENKPKKNLEQIQQSESPVVASLFVATDQTLDTSSHVSRRNERIDCHETTTHIVEVHKNKTSEKEPESSKETSCLMANVSVTESSDECNTTTSCNPKAKRSFLGVRRQKNGRYGAVITDRIRHKKVWLDTFDTIEEASQAYLSKKSEIEKLRQQGNKENKPKNCDQIQQLESPVVASLSVANDQTLDTASVRRRNKRIVFVKKTTHIVGVHKRKDSGKYTSEIRNPTSNKRIWLGTFGTAEEASQAYQSKKLEFQRLVKEKQQQCTNKQNSKKDAGKEKLVNVKQGHKNVNCEALQSESARGSEIDVPISDPSNGGTDQRTDSHEIGTAEEAFHAYQSKIFDFQSSEKVELQSKMPTDYSAGKKQEGQEDEDLWMGEWVQLPGNREVKFSLKLGLPIIDNYGSLLGEFSTLDDLNIC
ncbi:hypothetical protein A4A49_32641 [Nicotiana attenuata]|uniref:AP2/ERF domain-containing protein n=1 Tax=Nicotiana attenuata TaxID=49451 RepID=A0A1J6JBA2_NICAT|nr:hypothetical protein A4A49_32641 [Nicotiana attenuata]